jgi:hypothetical protein
LTAQTQSNKRYEIVVLDPSTGVFYNAVNSPSDNSNNDFDPEQIVRKSY